MTIMQFDTTAVWLDKYCLHELADDTISEMPSDTKLHTTIKKKHENIMFLIVYSQLLMH